MLNTLEMTSMRTGRSRAYGDALDLVKAMAQRLSTAAKEHNTSAGGRFEAEIAENSRRC